MARSGKSDPPVCTPADHRPPPFWDTRPAAHSSHRPGGLPPASSSIQPPVKDAFPACKDHGPSVQGSQLQKETQRFTFRQQRARMALLQGTPAVAAPGVDHPCPDIRVRFVITGIQGGRPLASLSWPYLQALPWPRAQGSVQAPDAYPVHEHGHQVRRTHAQP